MKPARQVSTGKRIGAATLTVLIALVLAAGCGMKRPPLPPLKDGNIIAPPGDLTYTQDGTPKKTQENTEEGRNIVLTWTHTVDPETARIKPDGFKVFAATKTSGQCEGCPFIFHEVGTVPMPHMAFHTQMEKGLKYYFRVQALGPNGRVSKFSKTLSIESDQND